MLRALLNRASQRAGTVEKRGPTTGKCDVIMDDYAINMSDGLSGAFTSINMSALTPSADLYDFNDLVQVLYDGANVSDVFGSLFV